MGNKINARNILYIAAGLLLLVLVIVAVFNLGKIFGSVSNAETNQENSLGQQIATCTPAELDNRVTFNLGGGKVVANFVITNISSVPCTVSGQNYVTPNYDNIKFPGVTINHAGQPLVQLYTLAPGSTIYSQIEAPYSSDRCPARSETAEVSFTDQISSNNQVTFQDNNGNVVFNVPVCSQEINNSEVTISNWTDQPINNPSSFPLYLPGRLI